MRFWSMFCCILAAAAAPPLAAGGDRSGSAAAPAKADIGVDPGALSPVVDNPYMPLTSLRRTVHAGKEFEDGETIQIRVVATVRKEPATVAGIAVTVVQVEDYDGDELVEKTEDYYAQDETGVVYYLGERVDDLEDGKVVGHGGQWLAGEGGAKAGLFMPASPKPGDVFEQERAPGVAEDRSKVVAAVSKATVAAGTFEDCIEVEDFDPIGKTKQRKIYCRGVGLVKEIFAGGGSIELIELDKR